MKPTPERPAQCDRDGDRFLPNLFARPRELPRRCGRVERTARRAAHALHGADVPLDPTFAGCGRTRPSIRRLPRAA